MCYAVCYAVWLAAGCWVGCVVVQDVSCQPVFRNQEKGAITFVLSKGVLRGKRAGEDDDIQQLRVARGSDPNAVAGSIANKVRNGERYRPTDRPPLSFVSVVCSCSV
jgi:hypothetical protein